MDEYSTEALKMSDYPVNIEEIMHNAYLQYSLSVNVGRAIPDVRDGLKPVARRILYGMQQLGLTHTHSFTKCAQVVGEVMGKYHPHGDQAIYDTLVRMAQDFSLRHPLVWGQGNFGSIDGDPPAAYRYTECRMQHLAEELLRDLGKNTVDMIPTYDDKQTEPAVLPAYFPNLLVNGSTGIGVGMATNIPPHNLGEVIDACIQLIDEPQSSVLDLMQHIKGPDLPTGAYIMGLSALKTMYETGRGGFTMRSKTSIEESKTGAEQIVVTEIPYMVNKENLVAKIAHLVTDKVIPGISGIQDLSSSRVGIKIVITVKRNAMGSVVLNQLYKHTQLQTRFATQFLVINRNRPETMNLVQLIQAYLDHRFEVCTRRCNFDLDKAEAREHILQGLMIAVDNIDEVIKIIRAAANDEVAIENLMKRFELSKRQASAIIDMRLRQLTGLAIEKLQAEHEEVCKTIEYLKDLLSSREKLMAVIREELVTVRDRFATDRRTEIQAAEDDINIEDLIKREVCAVTVSSTGYIKRLSLENFRAQRRGGKGVKGMETKEDDYVEHLFTACTHDYLLFFTNKGQMHWLKVYEIPEAGRQSKGKAIVNLLEIQPDEQIRSMITIDNVDQDDVCVAFATKKGVVKKTILSAFKNLRRKGIRAINLDEEDELIEVKFVREGQQIMLFSSSGMACRFDNEQVRSMGRTSRGVTGMRFKRPDDYVVAMEVVEANEDILKITQKGMGKRSNIGYGIAEKDAEQNVSGYRKTKRGGKGVTSIKLKDDDKVVAALMVESGDEVMITTSGGIIIRFETEGIRSIGRSSQGVKVMNLNKGDEIISVSRIAEMEDDDDSDDDTDADTDTDTDGTEVAESSETPAEPAPGVDAAEDGDSEPPEDE